MGGSDDWMERGACRNFPTALFFPAEDDDDQSDGDVEIAKQVCASCPVKIECRSAQLEEPYGVRGDLSAEERGFRGRGRRDSQLAVGLQDLIQEVLDLNHESWMSADAVNAAILRDQERKWPRNSVNAALLRLHRRGLAQRDDSQHLLLYRSIKETS